MAAPGSPVLTEHREQIRREALSHALGLAFGSSQGGYLVVANAAIFEAYLVGDDARAGLDRGDSETSPAMTFEEMPEWERELLAGQPVDRTGLCDHCDKPQTGGAAGGGISPEHWCDDHRPADSALDYSDDVDAPEPWTPRPGERVVARGGLLSGPGVVTQVRERSGVPLVYVLLDGGPTGSLIYYADEVSPESEQPASVGPVPLSIDAEAAGCACRPCREERALVVDLVKHRLMQYAGETTAIAIYADWFGAR